MYMGMGFFTGAVQDVCDSGVLFLRVEDVHGRARRWDHTFVVLAIVFCLLGGS